MTTIERRALLTQEAGDDGDRLLETIDAVGRSEHVDAVGAMFVDLPPGTDTENRTAVADSIDGRRDIGQNGRVAKRGGGDE